MSKYDSLWKYVANNCRDTLKLSYEEINEIAGVPIDHSFLTFKKELIDYGYEVKKISMKTKTVEFVKK